MSAMVSGFDRLDATLLGLSQTMGGMTGSPQKPVTYIATAEQLDLADNRRPVIALPSPGSVAERTFVPFPDPKQMPVGVDARHASGASSGAAETGQD